MNRQLRRANEKSDKRREKEREKRKTARRAVRTFPAKSSPAPGTERTDSADRARPAPSTRRPVLTGAYLLLTVGVIAVQAVVPQGTDLFSLVVHGLFYLILGYFLCLWLLRRGVKGALIATVVGGILLAAGVEAVKLLRPEGAPDLLFVYLAVPGLLVGAWLGRFVYRRDA